MNHPGMINTVSNINSNTFEWSEENFSKVKTIIDKYPSGKQQSAVIPVLDLAQRQNKGWITKNIIEKVAETFLSGWRLALEKIGHCFGQFGLHVGQDVRISV